jgi:NAD-dependent DNA ligase
MAKPSRAKVKKLQSEAMKAAAERRAEKNASKAANMAPDTRGEIAPDPYSDVDHEWVALGISAPARRALIDEGFYSLPDLRKASLAALKEVHGIGPNVIRILVAEMKKEDIQFRSN